MVDTNKILSPLTGLVGMGMVIYGSFKVNLALGFGIILLLAQSFLYAAKKK